MTKLRMLCRKYILMIFLFSDPFCQPEDDDFVDAVQENEKGWIGCKKRSRVWNHFLLDELKRNRVKCKRCPIILDYISATTNMWRHMEIYHATVKV